MKPPVKLIATTAFAVLLANAALAKEIKTNTAQMQAMDKITGRVKVINVPVSGNINFGTFSILVRDCQTTPPEETPENYAFVDILDNNTDGSKVNISRGWMMSSTPSLNAVEHPIYDVWLLKCINTKIDASSLLTEEQLAERNSFKPTQEVRVSGEPTNLLPNIIDEEETVEEIITAPETANDTIIAAEEKTEEAQAVVESENNAEVSEVKTNEAKVLDIPVFQEKNEVVVKGLVPDNFTLPADDETGIEKFIEENPELTD
ncbi:MAG: DUF2155 domain-containing protein [Lactobacillaceae bacterium]|nr:DUF2155 domain-containing protein [Lactobacillaceae bacterium]